MTTKTKTITINKNTFELHPLGSVFWIEKQMLLIADVHLGKVSHFRKAGFPIPTDSISSNFIKLNALVDFYDPESVCFLGDLFHSDINMEWDLFSKWVCDVNTRVILVMGNHDIHTHSKFCDVDIDIFHEIADDGFLLTHKPTDRAGLFNFAGHIHPSVRLRGAARQFIKLPCFFRKPGQMILPAFGEFTGTYEMIPAENDTVYAIAADEVIQVN